MPIFTLFVHGYWQTLAWIVAIYYSLAICFFFSQGCFLRALNSTSVQISSILEREAV
jgi:hypothetical protein